MYYQTRKQIRDCRFVRLGQSPEPRALSSRLKHIPSFLIHFRLGFEVVHSFLLTDVCLLNEGKNPRAVEILFDRACYSRFYLGSGIATYCVRRRPCHAVLED
jgi:hypothetical protein